MNHIRSSIIAFVALFVALTGGVAYATHPGGANTISTGDIINGQVQQPDIAAEAVGTDQIKNNQVRSPDLKNGEVKTEDIADAAVTIPKLAYDPATQAELDALGTDDGDGPNAGSNLLHWSRLVGVPSGFADGTDDAGTAAAGWLLGGNAGTTGADFLGTTDNQALDLRVNSARGLRLEPASDGTSPSPNVIGGSPDNSVSAGVHSATIGGGGRGNVVDPASANRVTDNQGTVGGGANNRAGDGAGSTSDRAAATVAGGLNNRATGNAAAVGGGLTNTAGGPQATVAGGEDNIANGSRAAIGGGLSNRATGLRATVGGGQGNQATNTDAAVGGGANNFATGLSAAVPGGSGNEARGEYSLAAGRRAQAQAGHNGAFVWADSNNLLFPSTAANQFSVRATGGTRLVSGVDGAGAPTSGLELPANTSGLSTLVTGQPFDVRVNGSRAFRIEPASDGSSQSPNVVGGTADNSVSAGVHSATIAGGGHAIPGNPATANRVTDSQGTVGGGARNQAGNDAGSAGDRTAATVGGGVFNTASGEGATVGGGFTNTAEGGRATVAGGQSNVATGGAATVVGGASNQAQEDYSLAAGHRAQAIHPGAFVWADSTFIDFQSTAQDQFSVRATGGTRLVSGVDGSGSPTFGLELLPDTSGLSTLGSSSPFDLRVNNSRGFRIDPASDGTGQSPNVIGGTGDNSVSAGVHSATIGGGGRGTPANPATANRVTDHQGTVGGGANNQAGDGAGTAGDNTLATVGGGGNNTASGESATVAGGGNNVASGDKAFVGGGVSNLAFAVDTTVSGGATNAALAQASAVIGGAGNTAAGFAAAVLGGTGNYAVRNYTLAGGHRAVADHNGAFVWADSNDLNFGSTAQNQFSVRSTGGARFVSAIDGGGAPTAGVELAPGGGSWSSLSDEASKRGIEPVSGRGVLRRLADVPISTWSYRSQDESIRHIGPMAQDFYRAFGVGESRRRISSVDADGVALAAIKGLSRELLAERWRRHEQEQRLDRLEARLAALERR